MTTCMTCDVCVNAVRCESCGVRLCEEGDARPAAGGCETTCTDCPPCACWACKDARWDAEIDRRLDAERDNAALAEGLRNWGADL